MSHTITKEEAEALIKFREKIADLLPQFSDYQKHDIWLLRWLRARELNLAKAEDMLRKSLKWREEHNLDEIMNWEVPEYIDKEFICQAAGYDNDGCFVCTIPFGRWDIRKACTKGYKRDVIKYVGQLIENMMKFFEYKTTAEQYNYQFVTIMDFTGFSLSQVASKDTVDVVSEMLKTFEANYPESLKESWVINAPKYFEVLFAIVKPLLTARTLSKVHIHSSTGWQGPLLKTIHPDQLPSQYGGGNTTCKDYRVRNGFKENPVLETFPESELTLHFLAAGLKHSVEHRVSVGTTLSWNFRTDNYDLGYAVEFLEGHHETPEVLFACGKVDSHLHLQKGIITAEKAGTYTLILDNSHSRLRGKSVYYAVRVKSDV